MTKNKSNDTSKGCLTGLGIAGGLTLAPLLIIGIVIVVILLLCGGCCFISSLSGNSYDSSTTKGTTIEENTNLKEKPTTETTTEEEVSQEVKDYAEDVSTILESTSNAMNDLSDFLINNSNILMWENTDMILLASYIVTVQLDYEEAQKIDPPSEMEAVHRSFLAAMKQYNDAMDDLTIGVDNLDIDRINAATEKMLKGTELINQATKDILKYMED